ncbi:MAG: ATP-dependent DNA helicase RecG [candidate division Zixibacteria bacterium]|nr:ATP-dependent DNA helicase RecG [candidate division Zixibacteria bacterium]MDH3938450.1 ATP-dependent DNA helicase RecG [candidate division Zixibacteria bacterium]
MAELRLDSPLQYVKGVGPRKAEVLTKHDLRTVRDLLFYFPRQYLDRTNVVPINQLQVDQSATIIGTVKAHGILHGRKRRYEVILEDDTGAISLMWFAGVRYWQRLFKKGQIFSATGTVSYFMGYQIVHPDLERLEDDSSQMVHAGRIIPVYPQTAELSSVGLGSKSIRRVTSFIFENLSEQVSDLLPAEVRQQSQLVDLHTAIRKLHFPDDREQLEACRRRIAFDELLGFLYLAFKRRSAKEQAIKQHQYKPPDAKLTAFKKNLPFELTSGQKKVTREIFEDLQRDQPMTRMLQGDVGCGKTVVAIAAAAYVAENGLQVAFMAPTEILAEQHARTWGPFLDELGIRCDLLTSSAKPTYKKEIARACAQNDIHVLFGTHALIYDYVAFEKLGLVIIDEQHRFGVQQRSKLHAKGDNPDLLIMTATPIPRTLALTLYGDLDISTIEGLPPGRKPIRTVWRSHDAREKVHRFVIDEVQKGGQVYIIYPLIEKSEQIELENVEDAFAELTSGMFSDLKVGVVHGRVKPKERDKILRQFHDGDLQVLMATTVIEVGIDNPNATLMVIVHAERFGLAQLHQLRGRIGRSDKQATLVALAHPPLSEIARKRLQYFSSTADGFAIAEADMELRGPGEMFGLKQSGIPQLKAARLSMDRDLIDSARSLLGRLHDKPNSLDGAHRRLLAYLVQAAEVKPTELGGG